MPQHRVRYHKGTADKLEQYKTELKSIVSSESMLKFKDDSLKERIKILEKQRETISTELKAAKDRNKWLSSQIKYLSTQKAVITDHAIVRYCERVLGMDIESIVDDMVPDDILGKISTRPASKDKTYYWETSKGYQIYSESNEIKTIVTSREGEGEENVE